MKLIVTYNPKKDSENYLRFLTKEPRVSYGRTNIAQDILDQSSERIRSLFLPKNKVKFSDNKLTKNLIAILRSEYVKEEGLYKEKEEKLINLWKKTSSQIEAYLCNIFDKPFPFSHKTLIGNLTSLWINPYDYLEFSVYISMKASCRDQIRGIIHELNHFMFYYYYSRLEKTLGLDKYELLKESLTFFTNPEAQGYPDEKPLRKLYLSRKWKNIDEAICKGADLLKDRQ